MLQTNCEHYKLSEQFQESVFNANVDYRINSAIQHLNRDGKFQFLKKIAAD